MSMRLKSMIKLGVDLSDEITLDGGDLGDMLVELKAGRLKFKGRTKKHTLFLALIGLEVITEQMRIELKEASVPS